MTALFIIPIWLIHENEKEVNPLIVSLILQKITKSLQIEANLLGDFLKNEPVTKQEVKEKITQKSLSLEKYGFERLSLEQRRCVIFNAYKYFMSAWTYYGVDIRSAECWMMVLLIPIETPNYSQADEKINSEKL